MDIVVSLFLRFMKGFIAGVLMYYSLSTLHVSHLSALASAMVPVFLGSLNIASGLVYLMTGVMFIIAAGSILIQDQNVGTFITQLVIDVKTLIKSK